MHDVVSGVDTALAGGRCVLLALCEGAADHHGMSAARMASMAALLAAGANPDGNPEAPCRPMQALLAHSDCPAAIQLLIENSADVDAQVGRCRLTPG